MCSERTITSFFLFVLMLSTTGCYHGYYVQSNPNHPITSTESGKPMPEGAIAITGSAHALVRGDNELYYRKRKNKGNLSDLQHDTNTVPADRSLGIGFRYQTSEKVGVGAGLIYSEQVDAFVADREPYERLTLYIENVFYEQLTSSKSPWKASFHVKAGVSLLSRDRTFISGGVLFQTKEWYSEKHEPNQHTLIELLAEPILYGPILKSIGVTIAPQYYSAMFSGAIHQRVGFRLGIVLEPTRFLRITASSPIMSKSWVFGQGLHHSSNANPKPYDDNTFSSVFRNVNVGIQLLLNP